VVIVAVTLCAQVYPIYKLPMVCFKMLTNKFKKNCNFALNLYLTVYKLCVYLFCSGGEDSLAGSSNKVDGESTEFV